LSCSVFKVQSKRDFYILPSGINTCQPFFSTSLIPDGEY